VLVKRHNIPAINRQKSENLELAPEDLRPELPVWRDPDIQLHTYYRKNVAHRNKSGFGQDLVVRDKTQFHLIRRPIENLY
jgi:hypothetical protein